jgi:7-cyano-7-deazaguanine reductase
MKKNIINKKSKLSKLDLIRIERSLVNKPNDLNVNKLNKSDLNSKLLLGNETEYNLTNPDKKILQAISNPHCDLDYVIRFSCPEFTSLCPITSQPDFAHLVFDYVPGKLIIESKSLKLYLFSYRNHGAFHEDCSIKIAKDLISIIKPKWLRLSGFWFPRGGIPIDIFFQTSLPPKNIFINDNPTYNYKAR